MEVNKSSFFGRFTDRVIILSAVLFAFLPSILSFIVEAALVTSLIINFRTRKIIFSCKLCYWLLPIALASIIPPIFYRNYVGIIGGVGLVLLLIFGIYLKKAITSEIFEEGIKFASVASVIVTFVAVIERIAYAIWPSLSMNKDLRCAGVFFNPNMFGTAVVFVILACLYKIMSGRGDKRIYTVVIIFNLVSMALCGSLLGMAELVCGVFFLLLFNKRWKLVPIFIGAGIIALAAVLVYPKLLPRLFEASDSFNSRYRVWQLGVYLFKQTPIFGRGVLTYMMESPKYVGADLGFNVWVTTCAHSLLLDGLLCLGIVGTTLVSGFFIHYLLPVVKNIKKLINQPTCAFAMAVVAGVLFHGIFDETVAWPQLTILFLFILSGAFLVKKE